MQVHAQLQHTKPSASAAHEKDHLLPLITHAVGKFMHDIEAHTIYSSIAQYLRWSWVNLRHAGVSCSEQHRHWCEQQCPHDQCRSYALADLRLCRPSSFVAGSTQDEKYIQSWGAAGNVGVLIKPSDRTGSCVDKIARVGNWVARKPQTYDGHRGLPICTLKHVPLLSMVKACLVATSVLSQWARFWFPVRQLLYLARLSRCSNINFT